MNTWARDRNRADELRACIESAGDRSPYDVLMPRLVATLPDNYFYAGPYKPGRTDVIGYAEATWDMHHDVVTGIRRSQPFVTAAVSASVSQ